MYDFFRPQDLQWDKGGLGTRIQNIEPLMFWHSPMQTQGPEPMTPQAPNQSIPNPPPPSTEAGDGTSAQEPRWQLAPGEGKERRKHSHRTCAQFQGTTVKIRSRPLIPAGNWHTQRRPTKDGREGAMCKAPPAVGKGPSSAK